MNTYINLCYRYDSNSRALYKDNFEYVINTLQTFIPKDFKIEVKPKYEILYSDTEVIIVVKLIDVSIADIHIQGGADNRDILSISFKNNYDERYYGIKVPEMYLKYWYIDFKEE